ncbi:MAG: hypothetical protein JNG88_13880, partial [Phycisphaerales bacterium]|nr:hypothetical protein [Phycisphaerales bacterium]
PQVCGAATFTTIAGEGIRTLDVQLGNQSGSNVTDDSAETCERLTDAPACSPDTSNGTAFADADLRRVADAWPALSAPIRRAVLALIETGVER